MLIATAMDGNQHVLPLAFAIVNEKLIHLGSFLQQLSRHVIRGRRGMCLTSDRHGGIIKAVRECSDFVSPHGVHREEIKRQKVEAFVFLDQINKKKWTASHDGGWRCDILTTNMSECINGVLKGACRLPLEDYWDDQNFSVCPQHYYSYFHTSWSKPNNTYSQRDGLAANASKTRSPTTRRFFNTGKYASGG
ncbi:hypothetical protein Sango_1178600 [Sesamum angolense]|uniref:Uncharacterized protein n=1 Tax=Sesamum angolense TaxID=2727404 RepID=A0AAE1WWB9_9LAMI|nr:hypothetical protein Sango_1178600 [Sesamum angolense]